jgi:cytochrome b involved in lipid metabolism
MMVYFNAPCRPLPTVVLTSMCVPQMIIDASVYDLTAFYSLHPGGGYPLKEVAGQDATEQFYGLTFDFLNSNYYH